MDIKVNTNAADLARTLGRIPTRLERELYPTLDRWGHEHITRMAARMRAGGQSDSVKTRTGLLRGSFTHEVRRGGGLGNLRLRVFSAGVKYADIQERGGIVRAKGRKFLAIPQPAVKTASGVARYASPRSYPGETFVFRSKKGSLWIAEKKGKGAREKIVLLWQLVKSVRIKGRLGWFDTWRSGSAQRSDLLKAAAHRALEGAGKA